MNPLAQQVAILMQSFVPAVPTGRIHRIQDDQDDELICTKCGQPKTYDDFYYNHSKKERQYECKACVCAAKKLKRAKEKAE